MHYKCAVLDLGLGALSTTLRRLLTFRVIDVDTGIAVY